MDFPHRPDEGWCKRHFEEIQRLPCSFSVSQGLSLPSRRLPVQSRQRSCTWEWKKLKYYWSIAPGRFDKYFCSKHKLAVTSFKPSNSLTPVTILANYQHMPKWKLRCHLKFYYTKLQFSASPLTFLILRHSAASVWEFRHEEKLGILVGFWITSYMVSVGGMSATKK